MFFKIISLTLLLFLTFSAHVVDSAKLYKIVDENGKVTFSQFPPEDQSSAKVEDMEISVSEAKTKVEKVGAKEYCGSIVVSQYINSNGSSSKLNPSRLARLQQRVEYWEQELDRKEQNLESMSQRQFKDSQRKKSYESDEARNRRYAKYSSRHEKELTRVKDLRCAIAWAESKLGDEDDRVGQINAEVDRLRNIKAALRQNRDRSCGEEPIYDPSQPHLKHAYTEWKKCNKRFMSDIANIDRKIRAISVR